MKTKELGWERKGKTTRNTRIERSSGRKKAGRGKNQTLLKSAQKIGKQLQTEVSAAP